MLIAPWGPSQPCLPHLLRLCVDHPRFFPYRQDLPLQQGYVLSGKSYHLHAWGLSCSTTKQQDFKKWSLDSPQLLGGPLQTKCMRTGGFASLIEIDLLGPTAAQIAAFLYYLFDTRGLSPQTMKGYWSCLSSVHNRTGKAAAVQAKTISDMITSMELQRPRMTQVLPQWDLDIVLEALSKPPYEPLREASLKHLTLKTAFLLVMASAGRRSVLQALVFCPQYIQFKPKGAGVKLYFTPEFMRNNQMPYQVNDPWYVPAVPTG